MTDNLVYYPHENHGAFLPVESTAPPPPLNTFEHAAFAMDVMLDNLHRLPPDDADFVDYFHCWLQAGGPDMEWMRRRVLDLYRLYGFENAPERTAR